jgi:uncharacterized protein (DUF697 family)
MTKSETQAIVTLSLLAAFADGDKHEREGAEIKRITEGLSGSGGLNLPTLYEDVLMKRVSLASVAAALTTPESRRLAYEMAVCVCDADGVQSKAEHRFLDEARDALGLAGPAAAEFSRAADELAAVPLGVNRMVFDDAELDRMIINAAVINGALELLPESLSTMAIIPLQMQLVYRIGKANGYRLDSGHVKDFLATAGVGLTSQFLENAGRRFLGRLLGQALSSGMSFASTYALGQVAKRYYAGGRELSAQMLRETYEGVMQEGRNLQSQYLPAIQEKARTLDASKVLEMVRGS